MKMSTLGRRNEVSGDAERVDIVEMDFHSLCRLCGNMNMNLLPVYTEEGAATELMQKIADYLNISISLEDVLPKKLCIHCSNTLSSWHSFFVCCQETNSKFHSMVTFTKCEEVPEELEALEEDGTHDFEEDIEIETKCDDVQEEVEALEEDGSQEFEIEEHIEFLEKEVEEHEEDLGDARLCFEEPLGEEITEEYLDYDAIQEPDVKSLFIRRCGVLTCPQCDAKFKLRRHFTQHLMENHEFGEEVKELVKIRPQVAAEEVKASEIQQDGRILYKCRDCGKILHSLDTFVWHRQIHTGVKMFNCHLCEKSFRIQQGLNRHLREFHIRNKNYTCDVCKKSFLNCHTMIEHKRTHTGIRPYTCEQCFKTFRQKAALFMHRKIHNPVRDFNCGICNQGFSGRYALQLHMKIHTGEKEHECEVCQRRFRLKSERNRHQMLHSDEKPFKCDSCPKSFRMKRYLQRHRKAHHCEKPDRFVFPGDDDCDGESPGDA